MKRSARANGGRMARELSRAFEPIDPQAPGEAEKRLDAVGRAELRALREAVSRIAFAAPPRAPRASLKQELLERLRPSSAPKGPQVWKSWAGERFSSLHVVRADEGDWETVMEGVRVKRLFADPDRDSVTMLIRMAPGSQYPAHRHGGNEECLVLEGDVTANGVLLRAGDYQCARARSVHDVTRTVNGCLLLIVSSTRDQLLA